MHPESTPHRLPAIELVDAGSELRLRVQAPGIDRESVDLSVEGRFLRLRAVRASSPGPGETLGSRERFAGALVRVLRLPYDVDGRGLAVEYLDGILVFRLPRMSLPQPNPPRAHSPRCDLHETATGFTVVADVPGVRPGDLRLVIGDESMVLVGPVRPPEAAGRLELDEIRVREYRRAFRFPARIDRKGVELSVVDGVAVIRVPKLDANSSASEGKLAREDAR